MERVERKCVVYKPVQVQDDSSLEKDSDKVILDDSSEADSEGDESDFYNEGTLDQCAKCGEKFIGADKCNAIGCDTESCQCWYPRAVQILTTRVCKYC